MSNNVPNAIMAGWRGGKATRSKANGTSSSKPTCPRENRPAISARRIGASQRVRCESTATVSAGELELPDERAARSGLLAVPPDVWQQGEVASPLDGCAHLALVTRTHTRHPARQNFALLRDQATQRFLVFVVDLTDAILTELAGLDGPTKRAHSSPSS